MQRTGFLGKEKKGEEKKNNRNQLLGKKAIFIPLQCRRLDPVETSRSETLCTPYSTPHNHPRAPIELLRPEHVCRFSQSGLFMISTDLPRLRGLENCPIRKLLRCAFMFQELLFPTCSPFCSVYVYSVSKKRHSGAQPALNRKGRQVLAKAPKQSPLVPEVNDKQTQTPTRNRRTNKNSPRCTLFSSAS